MYLGSLDNLNKPKNKTFAAATLIGSLLGKSGGGGSPCPESGRLGRNHPGQG